MKSAILFLAIVAVLALVPSCNLPHEKLDGVCSHPAVMGGQAFPVPEDAHFTSNGGLYLPLPEGQSVTLTGAFCVIRGGGSRK